MVPGEINLDFADVRTIMSNAGGALMGIGAGTGDNRAQGAAKRAILSPLLEENSIEGSNWNYREYHGAQRHGDARIGRCHGGYPGGFDTEQVNFGLAYDDSWKTNYG